MSDERRTTKDRRQKSIKVEIERRRNIDRRESVVDRRLGLERFRGPGKRIDDERKSAEEGEMTDEQFIFLMAIEEYKKKNNRPFPTWTEVLEVIKALGYRKVADPQSIVKNKKEEEPVEILQAAIPVTE